MPRFLVLFKSTLSAEELMSSATPEQIQAAMEEWSTWKDNLDTTIGFEWGMPLQIVNEVDNGGVHTGSSPVAGYAIMQGDKEAIAEVLRSHPHLKRDGASIDLLQMMSMPGQ